MSSQKKAQAILRYQEVLEQLRGKLVEDMPLRDHVCEWLRAKVGDEAAGHLCDLSDDIKIQACVDHIKIGLASGDVKIDDVEKLLK